MKIQGGSTIGHSPASQNLSGEKNRLYSILLRDIIPFVLMLALTSWLTLKAVEIISMNRPAIHASVAKH